jgi:hypothetical protein
MLTLFAVTHAFTVSTPGFAPTAALYDRAMLSVATPDVLITIVDPHAPHQLRDVVMVAVPLEIAFENKK